MRFYQALIRNHPLANITFVVVLLMGTLAYLNMPREQDPEINFNWLIVTAVLPGAGAEDVERKVTQPMEEAVAKIGDIRFISSTSRESVSTVLVRFRDIPAAVFDKRVTDLRREVQAAAKRDLPPEVDDPRSMKSPPTTAFPAPCCCCKARPTTRRCARPRGGSRSIWNACPASTRSSPPACPTRNCASPSIRRPSPRAA
jgi:multidrug efflux pump subunit AcrB